MVGKQQKCAIAIFSFDGYADLWEPFFDAWFRFWPDCPYPIYLQTNNLTYDNPRIQCISVGDDRDWSTSARAFLNQIPENYVIAVMEDYLLLRPVDGSRIKDLVNYSIDNDIGCLRLYASPGPNVEINTDLISERIGVLQEGDEYRLSLQAGIWNKNTLYDLIVPGESAWSLEIEGSKRSILLSERFLSLFGPADETCPLPYFCTAVEKGEWIREAVKVCLTHGVKVDLSKRRLEPAIQGWLRNAGLSRYIPYIRNIRSVGWREGLQLIINSAVRKVKSKLIYVIQILCLKLQRRPTISKREREKLEIGFVSEVKNGIVSDNEANLAWRNFSKSLYADSKRRNVEEFLDWDVVRATMFFSNAAYTKEQMKTLRSSKKWYRFLGAIREDSYGCPHPTKYWPLSSGNLVHHASHVHCYEEMAGIEIDQFDAVVEFGGGYGSMCRLFHRLGFSGDYLIFDLPPFSALQKLFLSVCGNKPQESVEENGVFCSSEIGSAERWIDIRLSEKKKILFVATWSLSEAPIIIREPFIERISQFSGVLLAYQDSFQSVDNVEYFDKVSRNLGNDNGGNWRCAEQLIPKMPVEIGRYLFAVKDSVFR